MGKLIVITGMLASGKSTLASNLSFKTNIPYFCKDSFKEALVDKYGFTTREENRILSIQAVKEMFVIAENHLKQDRDVILEANFRNDEISYLEELTNKYKFKFYLFMLVGSLNILYERFLSRVPTRHKAHLSIGLDKDYSKFIEYNNMLEESITNKNIIKIDMSLLNQNEVLDKVISYLV